MTRPAAISNAARLRREGEALADPLPGLRVEAERIAAAVALGVHGRRRPGMGETFWEYRRFRQEDPASRIDWRRSARSDALFVRENEWEAAQSVWLWRDGRPGMEARSDPETPTKKARASVLLIALAALLTRAGERVAVMGESAAPRAGRVGLDRVSRRLADGPGAAESVRPASVAARGRATVASDFYDGVDVWRGRLQGLWRRGIRGALLQIVDPAEEDFPFSGRIRFAAPAGLDDVLIGDAREARAAYRQRFQAHRAAMRDLARQAGWSFVSHRTDRPATEALLALFHALSEGRR